MAPYFRRKPRAATASPTPRRSSSGSIAGSIDSPTRTRGKRSRSKRPTLSPARARKVAVAAPPGPPPITAPATDRRDDGGEPVSQLAEPPSHSHLRQIRPDQDAIHERAEAAPLRRA